MSVVVVGSISDDLTVTAPRLPGPGETVLGDAVIWSYGGKGNNQAVAAAASGAKTYMIGAVGPGGAGDRLAQATADKGVDMHAVEHLPDAVNGLAVIFVDQAAENSIIVAQGANLRVLPPQIDRYDALFTAGSVLLLQNEIPAETVQYCLEKGHAAGMITILNPAPFRALPLSLCPCIDYLTPNQTELRGLLGHDGTNEELAAELLAQGVKHVVLTLGSKGAALFSKEGSQFYPSIQVQAVDTTGAGDCFCGYLAGMLAQGSSFAEAVQLAVVAAGISVTKHGAQGAVPKLEEVRTLLAKERS